MNCRHMIQASRLLLSLAASFVLALGFLHPAFTTPAFAAGGATESNALMAMPAIQPIIEKVDIESGSFSVTTNTVIPSPPAPIRIGQALVSLSPDSLKEGTIKEIKITGPKGVEFGCLNVKVKNNTDLIKACGGPSILEAGATTYQASGVDFGPEEFGTFSIILIP